MITLCYKTSYALELESSHRKRDLGAVGSHFFEPFVESCTLNAGGFLAKFFQLYLSFEIQDIGVGFFLASTVGF